MNYQTIFLILTIYQLIIRAEKDDDVCIKSEVQKVRSELSNSIMQLKDVAQSFFGRTLTRFEKRRQHIKKSFYRFIEEVFCNKKFNCTEIKKSSTGNNRFHSNNSNIFFQGY